MKVLLIYNPMAGGGKAGQKLGNIRKLFVDFGIETELIVTRYKGYAIEIVANSQLNSFDGIVAAGGDGTFFEVLNGYFKNKGNNNIPLGLLPIGTGNSLARDIIEKNDSPEDFIRLVKEGNTRLIDVIKVQNSENVFYFANTMGLGFVSDVINTASGLKFFGKLAYTFGVLYNTLKLRSFPVKMTIDGKEINLKNVFISFSNSRYTGGNYLLAPDALIDDGIMDLIVVNKLSRLNLLKTFPKIFPGKHVETPFVETMKAKEVTIETTSSKFLSPDGELFGKTPAEISCTPSAIRVFSGKT